MIGKKYKNKYPIGVYLILLIAAATFITGVTASKYIVGASSSDEARVAVSSIDISADSTGSSSLAFSFPEMKPNITGDTGEDAKNEVSFFVINFKGSVVNETAISYNINIAKTDNIPVIYTVYKIEDDNSETLVPGSTVQILPAGTAKAQKYKVYAEWDKSSANYKDFMYSYEIDWIVLSVDWTQID